MEKLTSEQLKQEQEKTLASLRMPSGLLAAPLFVTMDLLYGRKRTLSKFKVLEIIARVPYQAWENVAYVALTHTHANLALARRIVDRIHESRLQQDNEQWHLLILEELIGKKGIRENFLWYWFIPQIMAFVYYNISWFLYAMRPRWSYMLNVHFEDHAEHEYMEFVREHPELEQESFTSIFEDDYGRFDSVADLFRRIALDERQHKEESLARIDSGRFS